MGQQQSSSGAPRSCGFAPRWPIAVAMLALVSMQASAARAEGATLAPTSPTTPCPADGQDLVKPAELVSSGGVLKGTINLSEEHQRLPTSVGGAATCAPQLVRIFRGEGLASASPAQPPDPLLPDPIPGPTLRARVGNLVQLTFVNQVNSNRFDRNIDLDACMRVGEGGSIYPASMDTPPNCLHASSTANIHFHGTHTNPNATGDNVYLQVRPLPRDRQGNLTTTPAEATALFKSFFDVCAERLKNPLTQWPVTWSDIPTPSWTDKQAQLLDAFQKANPDQPIWTRDQEVLDARGWPQYYIGAVPYCFALPAYTAQVWPPPPGSTSPNMGQAPGTHWYHAHKHGSTAINVANGMTGAFIIEGKYDDDLNAFYQRYVLKDGQPWNTRAQPVLVLNQLGTTPNRLVGGGPTPLDLVVNGRLRPKIQMQPGEVQLWRIINTSGRSAAYFMAPEGLEWRQLAQDGVQFADQNYRNSENKPFYMAPGNRVDLLVKAPMKELSANILIQNVVARNRVKPSPVAGSTDPNPGTVLMSVTVAGPPVRQGGQPSQMPFINPAPKQPVFLADITDDEWRRNAYGSKRLDFNSKGRGSAVQHTINNIQFLDNEAEVRVELSAVEQWTITNSTVAPNPGTIDHPFHIHINPFQIVEVFDPNENLVDPSTGQLLGVLNPTTKRTDPIPKYVFSQSAITLPDRQCVLDPNDPRTWQPCHPVKETELVWWDVFAIPSGRVGVKTDGSKVTIPGYFKMRSRFVDYAGLYVLHCHILIHEDRGMMFSVNVGAAKPTLLRHH